MGRAFHWFLPFCIVILLVCVMGCTQQNQGRIGERESPAGGSNPIAATRTTVSTPAASFNAGYLPHSFTCTDSTGKRKTLAASVRFPTDDTPSAHESDPGAPVGEVFGNGRMSVKKPFPLVVFSQGYGGSGLQSVF